MPSDLLCWCQRFVALDMQNHVPKVTSRIVFGEFGNVTYKSIRESEAKLFLLQVLAKVVG